VSISLISAVWQDDELTTQSELLVMLALADWANPQGECWPAIESIAKKARLCERHVQRVIKKLIGDRKIGCSDRNGGRNRSTRYLLYPEKGDICDKKGCHPVPKRVTSDPQRVTSDPEKGDIQCLKGDIAMSPDPSVTVREPLVILTDNPPTIPLIGEKEAITQAEMAGVTDVEFTLYIFADWRSREGRDAANVKVSWIHYVKKRWVREGEGWRGGVHTGKGAPKPKSLFDRQIEQLANE